MIQALSTPSLFDLKYVADASSKRFDLALTQGTIQRSPISIPAVPGKSITQTTDVSTQVPKTFSETIFDHAVQLKVLFAQYTMHLEDIFREKTFSEIDRLLNAEDWYEDDTFPSEKSFRNFVSWSIYASEFRWNSLGVSNDGTVLVAWIVGKSLLTANFLGDESVRWTARIDADSGSSNIVGSSPLTAFSTQFRFLRSEMNESVIRESRG